MADPAEEQTLRDLLERLFLAGMGAAALTRERVDELADELAERGGVSGNEARQVIEEMLARWRGDASRLGERAGASLSGLFRELGLVTRREYEELELRLAQLEHRIRLTEGEGRSEDSGGQRQS